MKSKISDWWIRLQASYWFVPALMSAAAMLLAVLVVHVDTKVGADWLEYMPWLQASQPAGARALLSTVAGSMITVAGVTFSMTLLAVSHASAQIGPRLLSGFMRDRGNQLTLGTFIATFLYCLMVLRTVNTGEGGPTVFVPHIAIMVSIVMAILSVVVLIFFIHHVPQSINVSTVIGRVGDELIDGIDTMYPERLGSGAERCQARDDMPQGFKNDSREIQVGAQHGYLRVLDTDGLMDIATRHDLVIKLRRRPGDFAIPGQPLMHVWPARRLNDDAESLLRSVFSWGDERTREQDFLFPVGQLIEVLGKAMSPGINGQHTAVLCLDQFERVFGEILQRKEPLAYRYDEDGQLRIVTRPLAHRDIVLDTVREIRQFVRGDWITTSHLLEVLARLDAMKQLAQARPLLAEARALIEEDIATGAMTNAEKRSLRDLGQMHV